LNKKRAEQQQKQEILAFEQKKQHAIQLRRSMNQQQNEALIILGVSERALLDALMANVDWRDPLSTLIKTQYRTLALEKHPDKHPENQEQANEDMKKLTAAYEIFSKAEWFNHTAISTSTTTTSN